MVFTYTIPTEFYPHKYRRASASLYRTRKHLCEESLTHCRMSAALSYQEDNQMFK